MRSRHHLIDALWALGNAEGGTQYGFTVRDLPPFQRSFGPVSIYSSPGQLGIGFTKQVDASVQGVKGSVGYQAGLALNADANSVGSSAFMSAFAKTPVFNVTTPTFGVGYSTTSTPDGLQSGFTDQPKTFNNAAPKLDLSPPADESAPRKKPLLLP